jgi:hypothetical protein
MKHHQRGLSLLGLLLVGGFLVYASILAAQIFPTWLEYQAINKAAIKARDGSSVAEVRAIFDKAAQIDDIKAIAAQDLDVSKEGDKIVVAFAYNREIHIGGPVFLLLKYSGRTK